jgi:hypothetical protein
MRRVTDIFGAYHASDYLYGRRGPWPQPAPDHPHGSMAGAVLQIPEQEQADWDKHVGRRYLRQLVTYWPKALELARATSVLAPLTDAAFVSLACDSLLSVFVVKGLDERDREAFRDVLAEPRGDTSWYKLDLMPMEVVSTFDGLYVAPTVTLLRRDEDGNFTTVAIDVEGAIVQPGDGDAWELAKYFVMQGAGITITLLKHPISHFPVDAINAITKTSLPTAHPIFKLIHPHCRLQLPVNGAVLHGDSTVLRKGNTRLYAPYPGRFRDNLKLVSLGWTGMEGNRAYPAYRYPREPEDNVSDYRRYLWAYWEVYLAFVTRVLDRVTLVPELVGQWADDIARWVPGFPQSDTIFDGSNLARAVAMFMWNVSVRHCAEHYLYAIMRLDQVPLRLRVPPPRSPSWRGLDRSKLVTTSDQFRYAMCMKMFFASYCIEGIGHIDYGFDDRILVGYNRDLWRELREVDTTLRDEGVKNRVPLEHIAASIQY